MSCFQCLFIHDFNVKHNMYNPTMNFHAIIGRNKIELNDCQIILLGHRENIRIKNTIVITLEKKNQPRQFFKNS